ncbi:TIM-barrel domain-containing protein [Schaalia sp. Marseille-Q2122]|uniref:glycoside hydrolase family 31 protein n=1 Tax=Schaalia sp. Marseille-Q2122 TaxID=2736604 RepID=UPI00158CF61F|nr:glycoside hydrolase family 31 protein [Schaalia sp. Marseille-Q2122]
MITVETIVDGLEAHYEHEVLRIQAWGPNALRVRITRAGHTALDHGALSVPPTPTDPATGRSTPPPSPSITIHEDGVGATLSHGRIGATLTTDIGAGIPRLHLTITRDGETLLEEQPEHFLWPGAHGFYPTGGMTQTHQVFASTPDERFYGLGQSTHGFLNHKGLVIDLVQRNGVVSIPFVLSNRGYGFLWNNPAVGRVEFASHQTRWISDDSQAIDYWVCLGDTPADILDAYTAATGRAPVLPEWASGFWQSKLRYTSQEELLDVAREYQRRSLPLSVIVSDFFHWTAMGDYRFDPAEFPDPAAMVKELAAMGTKLMVSVWPTIAKTSQNYEEMRQKGYLIATDQGLEFHQQIQDKGMSCAMPNAFYDATNPEARRYLWDKLKAGYHDLGIDVFWLDADEPEVVPCQPANLRFYAGKGAEVFNAYPRDHAKGVAEGLAAAGTPHTVLLSRSAWAGQAQYGTAVWSGDIAPTWQALKEQIPAGLSIGIAGIPWWTSDIGGFHGGDPTDPAYQELFIRWFQYGTFCPLFRLHGHREPREAVGSVNTGGPNEVWSYGEVAYEVAAAHIHLREKLRPYIQGLMEEAARSGLPPMRPLFIDFPQDQACWADREQFMFGPNLLVCPVTAPGVTSLEVYLPAGRRWRDIATGTTYEGGQSVEVPAPLERIPLFLREGADIPL